MDDHRRLKTREAEAVARREEQLRNYRQSDMYLQVVREHLARTIGFAWDSMFHAACAAADRDEVVRLLNIPANADVNCLNDDGLSALHQVNTHTLTHLNTHTHMHTYIHAQHGRLTSARTSNYIPSNHTRLYLRYCPAAATPGRVRPRIRTANPI